MKLSNIYHKFFSAQPLWLIAAALVAFFIIVATATATTMAASDTDNSGEKPYHVVTIYDNDTEKTVVTTAGTVGDALDSADISVSKHDNVDPAPDQKLQEAIVIVNIRRARPIVVVDGQRQVRVITAAQSQEDIAAAANVRLFPEDETKLALPANLLLAGGAGLEMNIKRAKVVNLKLYGQELVTRTQTDTVADFLKEKKIKLGPDDGMDLAPDAKIVDGLRLQIWRNGIQTVTATEVVPFTTKTVTDPTRKVGYHEIRTKGQDGQKTVIYEIETRDGTEVSRKIISEVVNTPAIEQVEIVGIKSSLDGVPALTASRGAQVYWVGPIQRKETYYDLPMKGVMSNCSQGGYYTVRADGAKVDRNGFVIVAANLNRYPRCSEVDTSLGRGKVYDTGGFAARNPEQFDLATDWSNHDGR